MINKIYFNFFQSDSIKHCTDLDVEEIPSYSNRDSMQENKRKRCKKINKGVSVEENCKRSRHIISFKSLEELTALDFENLLKNHSLKSNAALQNFQKNGMLTDLDRSAITEAVANAILQLNHLPTASEYNIAATKLCELFPCETKETYYCPPAGNHRNASGKLPDKIKNIKYQVKKRAASSWATSRSESFFVPSENKITHPAKFAGSCDPNDSAVKTAIARLKYDNIESWPELLRSWSVTHPLRFQYLRETRPISQRTTCSVQQSEKSDVLVNDYFKNWSVLTLPNGYLLIQQDFKELYPGREDGLISKWDSTKEVLINFLNIEIAKSDEYGRKLLTDLSTTDTDKSDVILFHLLPSLCCKRTRGASVSVPSVAEARKTFILHVLIPGDLNREIKTHSEWLANRGLNLQPTLIFVGPTLLNITASYVQIDTVRYKLRTPLKALDTCFKAFHALDAAYQEEYRAV
ncbi:uncharacterized protein LOC105286608 isoform X2 [Ooceraea biroi]|uniref:uncharacterized protein LOC105286608 isoform X2 n=1 Tax=Ooceraea biroi TaxID=2015173 RepID=UPI000F084872|nr:uncharacterized protein LOC105286608 isoform X2 [Ooceraea biroi]